jgi:hypothetical protein
MLAAVRARNRLEVGGDTLRQARQTLAVVTPAGWRAISSLGWPAREARRAEDERRPTAPAARAALALTLGPEGWQLLSAVAQAEAPP